MRLAALQAENDRKQKEVEEKQRLVQKAKNEVAALGVEKALKDAGKGALEGIGSLVIEKNSLIVAQKNKMDRLFEYFPVLSEYDFIMRLVN